MPYVWIPDGVDTRLMGKYVKALHEMLTDPDGPQELGILQICQELDSDTELYSAVWAHLDHWMRSMVKDIRARFLEPVNARPVRIELSNDLPQTNVITDDSIRF